MLFYEDQSEYLGHIISDKRIRTDPAKVKAVQDWPALHNVHDIRSFLGLTNYYQRFVSQYSQIALLLTQLL
jgi:hypothetical protein